MGNNEICKDIQLRHLLKDDRKNPKVYTTVVILEQEAKFITERIRKIREELQQNVNYRAQSRLISLRNRVLRCLSPDIVTRNAFVNLIDETWDTFFGSGRNENNVQPKENQGPHVSDHTRAQPSSSLNPNAPAYFPNSINQSVLPAVVRSPNNSFEVPVSTSSPGQNSRSFGNLSLPKNPPMNLHRVNQTCCNLIPSQGPPLIPSRSNANPLPNQFDAAS